MPQIDNYAYARTYRTTRALAGMKYHVVYADTENGANYVELASAAPMKAIGILTEETTTAGDYTPVVIFGPARAKCAAAVSFGRYLSPGASGKVQHTTSNSTDSVVGIALEPGVTNQVIDIFVNPFSTAPSGVTSG